MINTPHTRAIDALSNVEDQLGTLEAELAPEAARLQGAACVGAAQQAAKELLAELSALRKFSCSLSYWAELSARDQEIPALAKMPAVGAEFVLNELTIRREEKQQLQNCMEQDYRFLNTTEDAAATQVARTRDEVDLVRTALREQRGRVESRKREGVVAEEEHGAKETAQRAVLEETAARKAEAAEDERQNEGALEVYKTAEEANRMKASDLARIKREQERKEAEFEDLSEFAVAEKEQYREKLEADMRFSSGAARPVVAGKLQQLIPERRTEDAPGFYD